MPHPLRYAVSQILAADGLFSAGADDEIAGKNGFNVDKIPLSQYRNNSFYTMQTDALDRFGTRLEKRFTKEEIKKMMENCGLENINFSRNDHFWTAVGYKK